MRLTPPSSSGSEVVAAATIPPLVRSPEKGSKACGRIETRPAQPIDRPVTAGERRRLAIADQCVIFDPQGHLTFTQSGYDLTGLSNSTDSIPMLIY